MNRMQHRGGVGRSRPAHLDRFFSFDHFNTVSQISQFFNSLSWNYSIFLFITFAQNKWKKNETKQGNLAELNSNLFFLIAEEKEKKSWNMNLRESQIKPRQPAKLAPPLVSFGSIFGGVRDLTSLWNDTKTKILCLEKKLVIDLIEKTNLPKKRKITREKVKTQITNFPS